MYSFKAVNVIVLSLVFSLYGCTATKPGLITTLEDLNTESQKEGLIKVPQYRVISVPGQLPFTDVGGLYFYKTKRKPSSAIGLSPDTSFIAENIIESTCGKDCLIAIRDNLINVRKAALNLLDDKIKLTNAMYGQAPPENASAAEIAKYNAEITSAKDKYEITRAGFDALQDQVAKAVKDTGVFIYRWSASSNIEGSADLGSILSASKHKQEIYNGFALLSSLRTATLFVGPDLLEAWPKLDKTSNYSNRFELTTYVMQSRYALYMSEYDLQSIFQAKLDASYQQLSNVPETLRNLDRIELGVILAKLSNLSNMGFSGEVQRDITPIRWNQQGLEEILKLSHWQTVFTVKSDLGDIIEMLKPKDNSEK